MERLDKVPRKEFAWNGVSFFAPVSWEVGKIGRQYLMIEDDFGPVMELKWYRIKGKIILQDQLSHLAAAHKNKPGRTIRKIPIVVNDGQRDVCYLLSSRGHQKSSE